LEVCEALLSSVESWARAISDAVRVEASRRDGAILDSVAGITGGSGRGGIGRAVLFDEIGLEHGLEVDAALEVAHVHTIIRLDELGQGLGAEIDVVAPSTISGFLHALTEVIDEA